MAYDPMANDTAALQGTLVNPGQQQDNYQFPPMWGGQQPWGTYEPGGIAGPQQGGMNQGPSNGSDPWAGINPQLAAIYKAHGINTPGAAGMGFTDAQYWNDKPSQWQRLASDLEGTGPDQPGPGDAGNRSGQGQSGGMGSPSGGIMQWLQQLMGGGNSNMGTNQPYNQYAGKRDYMGRLIPQATNNGGSPQFGGGPIYHEMGQQPLNNTSYTGQPVNQPTQMAQQSQMPNNSGTLVGGGMNMSQQQPTGQAFSQNKPQQSAFSSPAQKTMMGAPSFMNQGAQAQNSLSGKPNQFSYSNRTGFGGF